MSNRYSQIIEKIFFSHYKNGLLEFVFDRTEIVKYATQLGIELPKNLGDLIYTFRYRGELPESIKKKAPKGKTWIIKPAGRSLYKFIAEKVEPLTPNPKLLNIHIAESTPGLVAKYALGDEQALLAKLRYNRLIDIFTGITCYSLQNHLRTTVKELGQVETDELYIGVDGEGIKYVLPVQAKGGKDKLNIVQIEQDVALCAAKFPDLKCLPIAAQFIRKDLIALFSFEAKKDNLALKEERHYLLVDLQDNG